MSEASQSFQIENDPEKIFKFVKDFAEVYTVTKLLDKSEIFEVRKAEHLETEAIVAAKIFLKSKIDSMG